MTYSNFELCLDLQKAGFPQLRKQNAMYYVRPDMLISIDDLSVLKSDGKTDFENIFSTLVFKPSLDDIERESSSFFEQLNITGQSGVIAYATAIENKDGDFIGTRAIGETEWEARCKLWLGYKQTNQGTILDSERLEQSESKVTGEEYGN